MPRARYAVCAHVSDNGAAACAARPLPPAADGGRISADQLERKRSSERPPRGHLTRRSFSCTGTPMSISERAFIAGYRRRRGPRARRTPTVGAQPSTDLLAAVAPPWDRLERTLHGIAGVRHFREQMEETAGELIALAARDNPRLVRHGDFTTDNILIDGVSSRIIDAIGFASLTGRPRWPIWPSACAKPAY